MYLFKSKKYKKLLKIYKKAINTLKSMQKKYQITINWSKPKAKMY